VAGGAHGQLVQVVVLGLVQLQRTGQSIDDLRAGPGLLAAFQAGVVVDADPGQGGQLLAAQSRRTA
jgi:hypothetical protein